MILKKVLLITDIQLERLIKYVLRHITRYHSGNNAIESFTNDMGSEIRQGYTTRRGERIGFYQWQPPDGKKYTYEIGNESARRAALSRARKQRRAAAADTFGGSS